MTNSVKLYFDWQEFYPDKRQYQQNTNKLLPVNVKVAVEIDSKYLDSYTADGQPIITADGMVAAMMQLENAILPKVQLDEPNENWGDTKKETKAEKKTEKKSEPTEKWEDESSDDDGWDDVVETKKSKAKKADKTETPTWEDEWDN